MPDTQSRAPSPRSTMTTLLFENVLYWVCVGVSVPFFTAYFTRRGLTASQIGIVLTCLPICSLFAQPLWSAFADRLSCRKQLLVGLSVAAAAVAPLLYLGSSFWSALASVLLLSVFFQALLPLCDSLVIAASNESAIPFSRVRMGGTVGYAVVVILAGGVFELLPEVQFVVLSVALLVFAAWSTRLPAAAKSDSESRERKDSTLGRGVLSVFDTTQIVWVLLFAFVSYVGLGFHGSFLGRLAVENGHGQDLVGFLSAISAFSEVPILLISTRLVERFGEMRLLQLACFATALRLFLVSTGVVWVMAAAQLLQGVSYMTVYYSTVTYIARHVLPGFEATGQSLLVMVQAGLATVVSNLIGGLVIDSLGTVSGFRAFAFLTVAGALLAIAVSSVVSRRSLA